MATITVRHVLTVAGATVTSGALTLLYSLIAARMLPPAENGHFAQFGFIYNLYFMLFNLGLGTASTYMAASRLASDRQLKQITSATCCFWLLVSGLTLLSLYFSDLGQHIGLLFNIPSSLVYSGLIAGLLLLVLNQCQAFLAGKERFDSLSITTVIKAAFPFMFLAYAPKSETGFSAAVVAALGVTCVGAAILMMRARSREPAVDPVDAADLLRFAFRFGFLVYASNILHFLSMRGVILFLSYYHSSEIVGFFTLALLILESALIIPGAVGTLIFPQSSRPSYNFVALDRLIRVNIYAGFAISLILALIAPIAVDILLGLEYAPLSVAILHILPSVVLLSIPRVLSAHLSGRGHPEYPLAAAGISFVFGAALAATAVPSLGLSAAVWVTNGVSAITALVTLIGYTKLRGVTWGHVLIPQLEDFRSIARLLRAQRN